MSGRGRLASLTLPLLLAWLGAADAVAAGARAEGPATRAPATAPLRDPRAVHDRLQRICAAAGYGKAEYRDCAAAISRRCEQGRVRVDGAACWQWLVDGESAGAIDPATLRQIGGDGAGSR